MPKTKATEAATPTEAATVALDADLTPGQRRYFEYLSSLVSDLDEATFKATLSLRPIYNADPSRKADREAEKAEAAANKKTRDADRNAKREARAAELEAKAAALRNGTARGPGRPRKDAAGAPVDNAVTAAGEEVGSPEETDALDESATETDDDF